MCLVLPGACLLASNFRRVLYAASDHSVRSNCTETHLICETRLPALICYLYSHKKKHRIHTMGQIHFVLKLCISEMRPHQEFCDEERIKELALGAREADEKRNGAGFTRRCVNMQCLMYVDLRLQE